MSTRPSSMRPVPASPASYSVENNIRLASFFIRKFRGLNLDRHSLESAVCEGLRKASSGFDPSRGVKYSHYAGIKIRAEIKDALEKKLKETLGSTFLARLALFMGREERRFNTKYGSYPTDAQLAEILGATEKSIAKVRKLRAEEPISLHSPVAQGRKLRLIDCVPDASVVTPLEELLRREAKSEFEAALESLPPRQSFVLRVHYGIGEEDEQTLEEIGETLGKKERGKPFTKENIRLIENRAIDQVRTNFPSLAENL